MARPAARPRPTRRSQRAAGQPRGGNDRFKEGPKQDAEQQGKPIPDGSRSFDGDSACSTCGAPASYTPPADGSESLVGTFEKSCDCPEDDLGGDVKAEMNDLIKEPKL
mgnify:CR=1 FL=1